MCDVFVPACVRERECECLSVRVCVCVVQLCVHARASHAFQVSAHDACEIEAAKQPNHLSLQSQMAHHKTQKHTCPTASSYVTLGAAIRANTKS